MYTIIIVILLSLAAAMILRGIHYKSFAQIIAGSLLSFGTICCFTIAVLWLDGTWSESLEYSDFFLQESFFSILFAVLGGVFGMIVVGLLTAFLFDKSQKYIREIHVAAGLFLGARWGAANWDIILQSFNGHKGGITDPVMNKDVAFYIFRLPLYEQLYMYLYGLCLIGLVSAGMAMCVKYKNGYIEMKLPNLTEQGQTRRFNWGYVNISLFLLVSAWGEYLDRFDLYDFQYGVVQRAEWIGLSVNLTQPGVIILAIILAAVILRIPQLRKRIRIPSVIRVKCPRLKIFNL